nr:hypothetical protein [Tanacetum cinerariifolium]
MQTQTSNSLHNAIMEAGSKDRPPMLAPGNYIQWKSRIKRYIDTKPNRELIHYCLKNPPYELDQIDLVNPEGNRVVPDVSKPLPLGGPPGQVTIQSQYFFNKDLEYLVLGDKDRRNAFSISKLKAAYYQDFRLEELVPSLWIKVNVNTILVQPTVFHTGGLSARNSTSQDTMCNTLKLGRSRILGPERVTSWINNTRYILNDKKSFKTDTLDLIKVFDTKPKL